MAVRIGLHITPLQAQRRLGDASNTLASVYTRLSSGQRINRPSDHAAGLAVAESLDVQSRILNRGNKNLNDGISAFAIADAGNFAKSHRVGIRRLGRV